MKILLEGTRFPVEISRDRVEISRDRVEVSRDPVEVYWDIATYRMFFAIRVSCLICSFIQYSVAQS